jgi:hypothetical protein
MARRKYYRNRKAVMDVDPDALWYKSDTGNLILVDDDQFVQVTFDPSKFYRVKYFQINRSKNL